MARMLPIRNNPPREINVDQLQIATPCDMDWNDMRGDDRQRFCDACNLNVYNLEGMTRPEIQTLLSEAEGRVCTRLYRRHDGTVITKDCPVGLAEKAWRHARNGTLFAAASLLTVVAFVIGALAWLSRPSCKVVEPAQTVIQVRDKVLPPPEVHTMGEAMPVYEMGDVAVPEPTVEPDEIHEYVE